ncbi:putative biotin-protein ligase domain protein [Rickettsiales endosymbiont of Paramecium tredecaurelia]|uniref:BPL-N domain-containing protein n=1 Tax=Candidatus Sarmatiella mevalonica TaxID=2770581 RepID=UPI001920EF88|nr:BPL-N domain-containing protein [Candidatus Sarmatiella mevalonica]MBL3285010.1 putative biotin-protein ligase domain protein [Candidatus Sarmatiella mevalonica]
MKNYIKTITAVFYSIIMILCISTASAKDKGVIYIYQDEGVSQESLNQITSAFIKLTPKRQIKNINAKQLQKGFWTRDAVLFVMPGGADLPYAKHLNGRGNRVIKQYVADGGAFLGICAGAYYGSAYVKFDEGGLLEVLGKRELSFFQGDAIGPVLAKYDYQTQSGSRAAVIHTILPNIAKATVFYNGGGFFKDAQQYPNTEVIATYTNHLPAIVLIKYNKGKVLLSGVHFEYDPFLLDSNDKYIQKIIKQLIEGDEERTALFNRLMQLLIVI